MQDLRSLPPEVEGIQRGQLQLRVDNLRWDLPGAPSTVAARIKWWGERGAGSLIKLRPSSTDRCSHLLTFALRCGPKPMRKYLKDMSTLLIAIEDSRNGVQKGQPPRQPSLSCYSLSAPPLGHSSP